MTCRSTPGRRELLLGLGAASGALAGCDTYPYAPVDSPAKMRLTLGRIHVDETQQGVVLNLSVANSNTLRDDRANFHNVTLLGYSVEGDLLCRTAVGTVTHEHMVDDGKPVTVECPTRPHMLTFAADESPCRDIVTINIAVYLPEYDSYYIDKYRRRCNEGLPPNPRNSNS